MYHGIFKHLILFKSELSNSKCEVSALLTLIERLLLFYLKQMFVKDSAGKKCLTLEHCHTMIKHALKRCYCYSLVEL